MHTKCTYTHRCRFASMYVCVFAHIHKSIYCYMLHVFSPQIPTSIDIILQYEVHKHIYGLYFSQRVAECTNNLQHKLWTYIKNASLFYSSANYRKRLSFTLLQPHCPKVRYEYNNGQHILKLE